MVSPMIYSLLLCLQMKVISLEKQVKLLDLVYLYVGTVINEEEYATHTVVVKTSFWI